MRHELKTDPKMFEAVWRGTKLYEIRKDDRTKASQLDGMQISTPYKVDDELLLRETKFSAEQMRGGRTLEYTGREVLCVVTHKLTGYGLQEGWCILGIRRLELIDRKGPHDGSHYPAPQPKDPGLTLHGDVEISGTLVGEGVKTRDPALKQAEVGLGAVMSPRVPGWSVKQPPAHWADRFGHDAAVARMHSTSPFYCMGTNCFSDGTTPHSPECIAEYEATVNPNGKYDRVVDKHVHKGGTNGRTETTATGPGGPNPAQPAKRAFSHYFRACPYDGVDVYRVLSLFEVANPAIQHAIKKLLVAGRRGAKDTRKDWSEAVVSINRAIEMMDEDKLD